MSEENKKIAEKIINIPDMNGGGCYELIDNITEALNQKDLGIKELTEELRKAQEAINIGAQTMSDDFDGLKSLGDKVLALTQERDGLQERIANLQKRFDERLVTPNEHEKYLIKKPLQENIKRLESELATANKWLEAKDEASMISAKAYFDLKSRLSLMQEIFKWLLGEAEDFPQRPEGKGIYYWRTELRKRIEALSSVAVEQKCEHDKGGEWRKQSASGVEYAPKDETTTCPFCPEPFVPGEEQV